jgi:hypothetical protein
VNLSLHLSLLGTTIIVKSDLKVRDDGILIQLLTFLTLSIVLFLYLKSSDTGLCPSPQVCMAILCNISCMWSFEMSVLTPADGYVAIGVLPWIGSGVRKRGAGSIDWIQMSMIFT